jgi:protein-S-isoprenylcysteine O-methyltransferase Ste14
MENKKDNPGVFIPPPLFYAFIFLLSFLLQGRFTIRRAFFFHSRVANIIGIVFIIVGFVLSFSALRLFFKSKNSVVTIKPATSLQTSGIYSISRNPMYTSLLMVYSGLALIFGNWWTLILLPVLFLLIRFLVILPEERYLSRAFGNGYAEYKKKVRRWI